MELNASAEVGCGAWSSPVRQRGGKLAGRVASHKAPPLTYLLEHQLRQRARDVRDEEPHGVIPEKARVDVDEEQHGVEPVAEHPPGAGRGRRWTLSMRE
jgi:hypothetical protein